MFVYPARDGTPLPAVFTKFADGPAEPATRSPPSEIGGHRDEWIDEWTRTCCGDAVTARRRSRRAARGRCRSRSSRCSSLYPVVAILGRGPRPARHARPRAARATSLDRPDTARDVLWFTVWQAALSTVLTLARRAPGRVRARAVRASRPHAGARARDRAVRAADGRGRPRSGAVRSRPSGVARLDSARSCSRTSSSTSRSSCGVGGLWRTSTRTRRRPPACSARAGGGRSATVTLPALRPRIVAAASIVFLFCFTSFGVILRARRPTLRDPRDRDLPPDRAAPRPAARGRARRSCSSSRSSCCCGSRGRFERRAAVPRRLRAAREVEHRPRALGDRALLATQPRGDGGAARAPARRAGRPLARPRRSGFVAYYRALAPRAGQHAVRAAARRDLELAARTRSIATVIARRGRRLAACGRVTRRRRVGARLDGVLVLPLGVSAVTVGFGFLIALDKPPLDLRDSQWLVPLAQALVAMPFVVPHRCAGAARDRPAPARGRGGARRAHRRGSGARSTCPIAARAAARRGRVRVRDLAGRVRRDGVHRAARHPDAADRRSTGCSASPATLNFGAAMAASVDPDGADRGGDARRRSRACRVGDRSGEF